MKKNIFAVLGILLLTSGCKPIGEVLKDTTAPSGRISINSGAAYTNYTSVTLTINSSDSSEMYVTNTAGCETGGSWEAYSTTKSWTIGQTNNTATVYVKFKDRSQNVSSCQSDTIIHDSIVPTVTSLTPNAGNPAGGNSTTIAGSNFKTGAVVTFGIHTATCTLGALTSGVASQITCTVPAGSLGAVTVTVTNPSSLSATSTYTYQVAPTLTSVSPTAGALAGGGTLTLNGSGFLSGFSVTVGGTTCTSPNLVSATQATCTLPAKAAGTYDVVLINSDGQSATLTNGYTYQVAPTLTSVSPTAGALAGGGTLTLNGTGFLSGLTVTVGGTACTSPNLVFATQATCTLPAKAAGTYNVVLTNSDGQSATLTNGYTYQVAPTLTSVSPTAGALAGGGTLTLNGSGFLSGFFVTVGGTTCTSPNLVSATQATCTLPAKAAGTYNVVLTNSDGQSATLTNGYMYQIWVQEAYLKASNNGEMDDFGFRVSVSGDTIVVGADTEDSNEVTITNGPTTASDGSTDSGAAYVFKRTGNNWVQEAYLKASNNGANDCFGGSVSISGDTIVVGANLEDSDQTTITNGPTSAEDGSENSGAAYVFKRTNNQWAQEAYLKASNNGAGDLFGSSVSVSGDTIVVGALDEDSAETTIMNGSTTAGDGSADSGAAYVFKRTGNNWSQEAYLKASNNGAGDFFGMSVSVSGDTIVVGANSEDSDEITITNGPTSAGDGSDASGAAYVFKRTGNNWVQEAYLKASNNGLGDFFGNSVSLSGDTIVAGAYGEDSSETTITSETTSAVDGSTDSGAAYVFKRTGNNWVQEAYLKASNSGEGDFFGFSVSVSGDTIVVGAYDEDSTETTSTNGTTSAGDGSTDSGAAYVFKRTGSTWAQEAYLKASNNGAGDFFGMSVSVSGDTIVAGASWEDSMETTITNGTTSAGDGSANSGSAYVFRRQEASSAPTASSVTPTSGAPAGDNIIIFGSGFMKDASVTVGGSPCMTVTVQGPNEIICNLPAKTDSVALDIVVTNPNGNGSSTLSGAYTYP